MKVSQKELFGAAAILLYIVFFSHSPPALLRSLLSNTVVSVLVLAVLSYVTLYQSRTIGVLAILAFLLTMTRVTEHLDASVKPPAEPEAPTPPTNTPPPPPPPAPSTGTTPDVSVKIPSGEQPAVQLPPATSGVTASAMTAPAPAQPPPPPATLPPVPTAPAVPPIASAPPAPVMSCNIESFASF